MKGGINVHSQSVKTSWKKFTAATPKQLIAVIIALKATSCIVCRQIREDLHCYQ